MNYTFGIGITLFNIVIEFILIQFYLYHKGQVKHFNAEQPDFDYALLEEDFRAGKLSFRDAVMKAVNAMVTKLASVFHFWMFHIGSFLIVANFFALITGVLSYFVYKMDSPDVMLFGRLADRTAMFFAFFGLSFLGRFMFKKLISVTK